MTGSGKKMMFSSLSPSVFLERMIFVRFSKLASSSVGSKDIGAFYGVNRTNKINDYQMSDMKNVDCESFPYLATRRARNIFYNENKMAAICHDTDITNDYKVTGITEDGNFVYRGNFINCEGQLDGNDYLCEYMGDYVTFPKMQVITSQQIAERKVGEIYSFFPVQIMNSLGNPIRQNEFILEGEYNSLKFNVYFDGAGGEFVFGFKDGYETICIHDEIYSGRISVGKTFSIAFCNGENSFTCPDVVILIDSIRVFGYTSYADVTMEEYSIEDYFNKRLESGSVRVSFKVYDLSGNEFSYENYLRENKDYFSSCMGSGLVCNGSVRVEIGGSTLKMRLGECQSVVCMGAAYGGRFFACDVFGVDIFYTSGSGALIEKYYFTPGTSLGGAGAVSCADHGRWTALIAYGGALYAFKKNGMYRIYSSDGLNFYMEKVCDVGAVSREAVCVVSDVMYFLSETGLYRFTGAYPEELADNLGRHYVSGVLGGVDNKLYASLEHSGGCELVVYDASVGAYGVHDGFNAKNFVTYGGKLYGLDSVDGYVYEMSGERSCVEFEIITRKFFLGFEKKAINGLRIYFDFSGQEGEKIEVFVSYDNGEWEPCFKPITSGRLKYVPIKFKKCDELKVKISGKGVFTLKGMTLSLYSGGDIKQNR